MANSYNKVVLVGRLTRDPEIKTTKTGKNVCSFSLAVDKRGKDAGTNFFDCSAWEKTGDTIAKYTSKGAQILIEGRLDQRTWEQDGQKRSKVEVIVDNFAFLSSVREASSDYAPKAPEVPDTQEEVDISIEDIPF